jgi:hypothetical protein
VTAKVFAWPPVGVIGAEWTEDAPVQVSRSMVTGAERVSAIQRKRRIASLTVAGLGLNTFQAGYMQMLIRYLEGVHLVRLYSYPISWRLEQPERAIRRGNVTTDLGQTFVTIYGNKPNSLVFRPADFLTLFLPSGATTDLNPFTWLDGTDPLPWKNSTNPLTWFSGTPYGGTTVQITQPVYSDDSGVAIVPVFETVPDQSNIYLIAGASDTGVFRPVSYPRAVQPYSGNWTYDWEFREVFGDEVGGFTEVNPWLP